MNLRILLLPVLALVALLSTGCASVGGMHPVTKLEGRACSAQYQVGQATSLRLDAPEAASQSVDSTAPCFVARDGSASVYAPYALPRYSRPYQVTIESQTSGEAIFAPEVKLLDAQGNVTRVVGFDRFSTRGDILQATVFVNSDNKDERYLVIGSASDAVGQKSTRVVTGMMVVPVLVGLPFFGVHGTESTESRTLSYNGLVSARAESSAPTGRDRARRQTPADIARADICCAM